MRDYCLLETSMGQAAEEIDGLSGTKSYSAEQIRHLKDLRESGRCLVSKITLLLADIEEQT